MEYDSTKYLATNTTSSAIPMPISEVFKTTHARILSMKYDTKLINKENFV